MSRGFCSFFSTERWYHSAVGIAAVSPATVDPVNTDWALRLHRSVDMKRACLALVVAVTAAACSHPTQRASRVAPGVDTSRQAAFPKSPDVSREIMGWMVFADG